MCDTSIRYCFETNTYIMIRQTNKKDANIDKSKLYRYKELYFDDIEIKKKVAMNIWMRETKDGWEDNA